QLLSAISKHKGTHSAAPNFAYDLCIRKVTPEQRTQLDLSSWVCAMNGAEPVRSETLERFAEVFGPSGFRLEAFHPCYGLAEATLMVSGGKNGPAFTKYWASSEALAHGDVFPGSESDARALVSSGRLPRGETVIIVDPETRLRSPPNRIGEI